MDYVINTLSNGLSVIIGKTVGVSRATCGLWFKSGSNQESDNLRGAAHFLEHMIFKGTIDQQPNEYSTIVTQLGGEDNAWTNYDHTHFYIYLPKENVKAALSLMAKTIFNAAINQDEFKREKEVVIEEIRMSNDTPWSWLYDDFFTKLFRVSNYRHPILGYEPVLSKLTRNQLYKFYKSWYVPNNAVLVITGDLDEQSILEHVNLEFGNLVPGALTVLPEKREVVNGKSETYLNPQPINNLYMFGGFLSEGLVDVHLRLSINMVMSVLSGSFSSRLNQVLIEQNRVATSINLAYDYLQPNPAVFFMAESEVVANGSKIIKLIHQEIAKVCAEGVTTAEFERVQAARLAKLASLRESSFSYGFWLGEKFLHNRLPSSIDSQRWLINKQTPADLQNAARLMFNGSQRWVYDAAYPEGKKASLLLPKVKLPLNANSIGKQYKSKIQSEQFKNINLSYLDTPYTNTVAMVLAIPRVFEDEPAPGLANLMSQTIAKGTDKLTALQISERLEGLSAGLDISLGHTVLMVRLKVIAEKFNPALEILDEIIRGANYPESEIAIGRWQIEAERQSLYDSPWGLALLKATETLFPNYRLGKNLLGPPMATDNYNSKQLKSYHKKVVSTSPMLVSIVGNLQAAGNWKTSIFKTMSRNGNFKTFNANASVKLALGKREHIEQEKEQIVIVVCYPAVSLTHPEHLKSTLFAEILGGTSMNSRLFVQLRSQEGLAYSVTASRVADENTGILYVAISTANQKRDQALNGIIREVGNLCNGKISADEFELNRTFLAHQLASGADTNMSKANRLTHQQICMLPDNYYEQLLQELKSLTLREFNSWCKQQRIQDFSVITVGKQI